MSEEKELTREEQQQAAERAYKLELLESLAKQNLNDVKERRVLNAQIKSNTESMIAVMDELNITDHNLKVQDDESADWYNVQLFKEVKRTIKLNKKSLAETLEVEKSDLDTRGIIRLSEEGELTQEVYREHLEPQSKDVLKTKKTKIREKKTK